MHGGRRGRPCRRPPPRGVPASPTARGPPLPVCTPAQSDSRHRAGRQTGGTAGRCAATPALARDSTDVGGVDEGGEGGGGRGGLRAARPVIGSHGTRALPSLPPCPAPAIRCGCRRGARPRAIRGNGGGSGTSPSPLGGGRGQGGAWRLAWSRGPPPQPRPAPSPPGRAPATLSGQGVPAGSGQGEGGVAPPAMPHRGRRRRKSRCSRASVVHGGPPRRDILRRYRSCGAHRRRRSASQCWCLHCLAWGAPDPRSAPPLLDTSTASCRGVDVVRGVESNACDVTSLPFSGRQSGSLLSTIYAWHTASPL